MIIDPIKVWSFFTRSKNIMNIIKLIYKLDNIGIIIKMCLTWYHKIIYVLIFMGLLNTNAIADNLHLKNILVDSTVIATTNFGSPITLPPGKEVVAHVFSHDDSDTVKFYKGNISPNNFICALKVVEETYFVYGEPSNYQPHVYFTAFTNCLYYSSFPQKNWTEGTEPGPDFSYVTIYPAPIKP